jgi:hypothetical protein
MRLRPIGSTVLALGVLAAVAPATLAAPTTTTITIVIDFGDPDEPFTTTGGLLCDEGIAVTDPVFVAGGGRQGRGTFTFHLVKTLTCADGSGTFQLLVNAANAPTSPGTVGGFAVVGGTGDYAGLRGAGALVGVGTDVGITDHYEGNLSIVP